MKIGIYRVYRDFLALFVRLIQFGEMLIGEFLLMSVFRLSNFCFMGALLLGLAGNGSKHDGNGTKRKFNEQHPCVINPQQDNRREIARFCIFWRM